MIHINLLGEKEDIGLENVLQISAYVLCVCLALITCLIMQGKYSTELSDLKSEKTMLDTRLAKLNKVTARVDNLEKDKKLLKEKLRTIAVLKAKKHGPVHIIEDLNNAIPERAWLEGVKEKSGMLEIKGVALDNQTIAMFMGALETSPYFENVELVHSKQTRKKKVKLKEFRLLLGLRDVLDAQKEIEKKKKSKKESSKV